VWTLCELLRESRLSAEQTPKHRVETENTAWKQARDAKTSSNAALSLFDRPSQGAEAASYSLPELCFNSTEKVLKSTTS
jgi:hypothetical protein